MVKNTLPLLTQVASLTNYPQHVVKDVIFQQFDDIKSYIHKPTHSGYRLFYLGALQGNIKSVNKYLRILIGYLRETPTEELKQEFRIFWNFRRLLQQDKTKMSFKKRFGTWHWKKRT